jgi:dipeptidyl aminopeptidase/acylaminoacyl peptidase
VLETSVFLPDPILGNLMIIRSTVVLGSLLAIALPALGGGRPMTVDDLLAVKTVSDPQVSPDGKLVAYVVSEIDRATDKSNSDIWLVAMAGGDPRRLTTAAGADHSPRWSPDGKSIAFISTRGGSSQVWLLPMAEGGEARQVTKLPIDVSGVIWSPKGDKIAFTGEVYPGKTPEETAAKDKEKEAGKSKARIFDGLMIRHWSTWDEGKRSHLFVAEVATGASTDLIPRWTANVPPAPFGGSSDYAFSPDGSELAFTSEPLKGTAWSTNTDIWTISSTGGEPKNLTVENLAADAQPSYSPDGRFLAYVKQDTEQYESDLWVLTLLNLKTGHLTELSRSLDRPVLGYTWGGTRHPEQGTIRDLYATLDDSGTEPIAVFSVLESKDGDMYVATEKPRAIKGGVNQGIQFAKHGQSLVVARCAADAPTEVFKSGLDGQGLTALTRHNASLTSQLDLSKAEGFTFRGAEEHEVSGWIIKPPGFDPSKKYPVLFLIHGGPQGAWHDEWVTRWNYGLFAAPGYVVVAINPRGSTGYGQKFTLQISKDWTGRVYKDLMRGLDHALNTYPYLDGSKVAAAGGSYGGFMVNWIAGHSDRFQALISHAGVFDLTSKYGTTEELWFPEFEFGGTPWDNPDIYRSQSPSAFAGSFKTPTLVIHGALDFRVPDAQGIGMFTALQRQNVPSRLLWFPDEGHWVLKPANRIVWWREMHEWLAKYLK